MDRIITIFLKTPPSVFDVILVSQDLSGVTYRWKKGRNKDTVFIPMGNIEEIIYK